ncbi:hypothetical protein HAX54_006396 [Datura stramonium]|uniref:Uncharacterized protein n=1 Tax=Datura stramonium TaxID=4076 RepID=A0ABS8WYX8_DATST|nr:hypothetical protein [Datura stramonium]
MALQGLMTNQGIWCYRCRTCREILWPSVGPAFDLSQQQTMVVPSRPQGRPKQQQQEIVCSHVASPTLVSPPLIHEGLFSAALISCFRRGPLESKYCIGR